MAQKSFFEYGKIAVNMRKQTKILQFKVIIEQDEDGWFVASAPSIPGCHTQGKTYEEVTKNIREAIELCLEVAKNDKSYYQQIDWAEDREKTKFIGITEIPVSYEFPV